MKVPTMAREKQLEKALEKAVEALQGLSKELYGIYLASADEEETNPHVKAQRGLLVEADEALLQGKKGHEDMRRDMNKLMAL